LPSLHDQILTRIRNGVEEQLCADKQCSIGWQSISHFPVTPNGKRKSRCRDCRNRYQRDYWKKQAGDLHPTGGVTMKQAFQNLEKAWPETVDNKFEDKGVWDYERNVWCPSPFNYDNLPDPAPENDELTP
jgi:hypothetical protein